MKSVVILLVMVVGAKAAVVISEGPIGVKKEVETVSSSVINSAVSSGSEPEKPSSAAVESSITNEISTKSLKASGPEESKVLDNPSDVKTDVSLQSEQSGKHLKITTGINLDEIVKAVTEHLIESGVHVDSSCSSYIVKKLLMS